MLTFPLPLSLTGAQPGHLWGHRDAGTAAPGVGKPGRASLPMLARVRSSQQRKMGVGGALSGLVTGKWPPQRAGGGWRRGGGDGTSLPLSLPSPPLQAPAGTFLPPLPANFLVLKPLPPALLHCRCSPPIGATGTGLPSLNFPTPTTCHHNPQGSLAPRRTRTGPTLICSFITALMRQKSCGWRDQTNCSGT